ncbi:MAG TPA: hypothetical protein VGM84_10245 [Steroidobacteraceae bacterium]
MSTIRWLVVFALGLTISCSRNQTVQTHSAHAEGANANAGDTLPRTAAEWARGAQLFEGLGNFHRGVTTSSAEGQRFFDQGMRLMWAFNHDEASRSFARAAQLDASCAMCWWGLALTVGPNYNMPMMAEYRAEVAFDSLERAAELLQNAAPPERALVEALKVRYPNPSALNAANEGPVLEAYALAMLRVTQQFPQDLDIRTMYAESLMNINAWKLWAADGTPAPGTEEIVRTLEDVLAKDPAHPGANHYFVHAVESSPHPEQALTAAEHLRGMMPAAGHLEHMPAHIWQRVGRYEDAAEANRRGVAADRAYLGRSRPPDYYAMYVAHNFQFLAYSAAMEGRKAESLQAMRGLQAAFPEQAMGAMPGLDWYGAQPYMVFVRFGLWDEILNERPPSAALKALTGGYLFAKVCALAAKGNVADARRTLDDLEGIRGSLPTGAAAGLNTASDVLKLAAVLAKSQIEVAENDHQHAIASLFAAVEQEDDLSYNEPSDWFFPVRHLLGAELLKSGQPARAEAVYREDLRRNPDNGWSLFGLAQALRAQRKVTEATAVEVRYRRAWEHADLALTASAM